MKLQRYGAALAGAIASGAIAGTVLAGQRAAVRRGVQSVCVSAPVLALPPPAETALAAQSEIVEATIRERQSIPLFVWLALVLVGFVAIAALAARPRVNLAAAPPQTPAGYPASLSYGIGGLARAEAIFSSGGNQRAVQLAGRSGTVAIPAEYTHEARDISVAVRAVGALGSDTQILTVRVLPAPKALTRVLPSNAPIIRSFTLSKSAARGGETIVARSEANAPGFVRLTDATGSVWSAQPVAGRGTVAFTVPKMHADTPFIAVLETRRNNQTITASAGFVAVADHAHPSPQRRLVAIPPVVHAGGTLAIGLPDGASGANFTLTDAQGARVAVETSQTNGGIRIHLPAAGAPATLFATLTYERGKERQTFVRHIAFAP